LRDYGVEGQLGLEDHPQKYITKIVEVMDEIYRVLKKSGSTYLNLGDTYCGSWGSESKHHQTSISEVHKNEKRIQPEKSPQARISSGKWLQPKQLLLIPSRVAIALQNEGWVLRNDIIYKKMNPMPCSVKDRLATTYEHVFHFVKSRRYFYDLDAIREPWRDTNPYDLRRAKSKHPGYNGKYASGYNSAYRKNILGQGMKGQPVGDPFRGKNPGDVIKDYHSKAKPYLVNNPHRERQFGKKEAVHALGKNPGDVIHGGPIRPPSHPYRGNGWEENALERGVGKNHPLGKNPGDFWEIKTQPFRGAHFAVYPEKLCEMPIKSSCPVNGIVLDPFAGSGTTCVVAKKLGRKWIGIDINPDYCIMARKRLAQVWGGNG